MHHRGKGDDVTERVEDLIARLRAEIAALPDDSLYADELRRLVDEAERRHREEDHDGDFGDVLEQEAIRFEAEHTGLATLLRRIADTLGAAGI